jgi:hypothetical protein
VAATGKAKLWLGSEALAHEQTVKGKLLTVRLAAAVEVAAGQRLKLEIKA